MKILVTGGAGFVGSNLCEALAKDPRNEVYSLDNYFTGSRDNHVEGVTYIEGSTEYIFELVDFTPDRVFHLGEYSRVEQSFEDIDKVLLFNKVGTSKVLEFCRRRGCRLIYAGSSTKFGEGGIGKDQSPYAWSKSSNTDLIKDYGTWYGLDYAIVYFYNVYGKREIKSGKYATLIALFAERKRQGLPLTVVAPGTQQRNFTHVDDIVEGLLLVGEKGKGDEYGIGSPETYTVMEIAEMFGGEIQLLPERKGNRMWSEVITEKTEALGWKAKRHIKDWIMNNV
ncbi:UDP-glucose 4-epimerase [Capnocytophaga haemolytica]|uniref:ADP-L-glycero-D-manno-heptose-6-epimerase n=1 Tax=Capnocytophaga haemolytica TaxID=45243 RepID=A0AAX2GYU5_9FLAO|nr:NAD-dependent epimerase/dehydratase family protein [Capnocytophaga haemolytica]AMD84603.1 ADP-L-glycero-D-manno-heptose-6-epimerase [Capnocytophaga haemolytica]SFO00307.1 UDP-glucose 4-epimerase [Capnocytophaga haemolytica]SNV09007.1 dTDP-glucose 4,6-dehydratase [Capnocytophaga haemolytica]